MPAPVPVPVTRWALVLLVVAAGMAGAFQIGKVPPSLPDLRADLGLSLVTAGWVLSIFNTVGLVLGIVVGALAARLGERRAALGGLALIALAGLAGCAASSGAVLLLTRLIEGLGFIVLVVSCPALLMRATRPADLKLVFGLWGTYMPAGQALMMVLSPLLAAPAGWRGLWLANAAIAALMALALALVLATRPAGAPASRPPSSGDGLRDDIRVTLRAPGTLLLALVFGVYALQYIAVTGFLPTIFVEEGMAPATAAVLAAAVAAANAVGNVVGGALLHRGWPRWGLVAAASGTMGLASLGIYAAALPFGPRYALCLVFAGVGGWLPGTVLGAAAVYAPSPRLLPLTNGLIVQGSNLGQVVGPPAIAALAASSGGWQWSPAILLVCAALGVGFALALRRLEIMAVATAR